MIYKELLTAFVWYTTFRLYGGMAADFYLLEMSDQLYKVSNLVFAGIAGVITSQIFSSR